MIMQESLSIVSVKFVCLGYYRNTEVQHGKRGPLPCVDVKCVKVICQLCYNHVSPVRHAKAPHWCIKAVYLKKSKLKYYLELCFFLSNMFLFFIFLSIIFLLIPTSLPVKPSVENQKTLHLQQQNNSKK